MLDNGTIYVPEICVSVSMPLEIGRGLFDFGLTATQGC